MRGRHTSRLSTHIGLAALLFLLPAAAAPAPARASGWADVQLCGQRVATLQAICLSGAARLKGNARVVASNACWQTMWARLQVCKTRAVAASAAHSPPTSGALSAPPEATSPTLTTDKPDYHPGDTIAILGSGWQTGEVVSMTVSVTPATHPDVKLSSVADEDGNFRNTAYKVQNSDAGVVFSLRATGKSSGTVVQTAAFGD